MIDNLLPTDKLRQKSVNWRREVMRLFRTLVLIPVFSTVLGTSASRAAVTFSFNYTDAPGVGFNANGQVGIDRRAGLAQAGNYISSVLGPSYNATIHVDVNGSVTNDNTLASASSAFNSSYPGAGFASRGDVMLKILNGNAADPNPAAADAEVNWNFQDHQWAPLNTFQPGQLDLISTATHELSHALGFASDIAQNGSSGWGDTPGTASAWSPFDRFVADTNGLSIISSGGVLDGARWNAASIGGTGPAGLRFNGPNAVAAAGGPVYLYSPITWDDGSSGSHLDTDFYTGAAENMMNHASSIAEGLDFRTFSAIELGILKDIGYTNVVVPEPTSLSLVATFLALVLRRRHRVVGQR